MCFEKEVVSASDSSGSVVGSSESTSIVLFDSWNSSSISVNCSSRLTGDFSGVSTTMISASSMSSSVLDVTSFWVIVSGGCWTSDVSETVFLGMLV